MAMSFKALQNAQEMRRLLEFVREHEYTSYLEVGAKYGGSLWQVAQAMPLGSRVVAIDLPNADGIAAPSLPSLEQCCTQLGAAGYDVDLIIGDSTAPGIVELVKARAPPGGFDVCLIDGGHDEATVRSDWANYGSLAHMVAFHDIAWPCERPIEPISNPPRYCHVGKVWRELREQHWHVEFSFHRERYGIGVLLREPGP